jgi:hypothetical protein
MEYRKPTFLKKKDDLKIQHKSQKDRRIYDRIKAVPLYDDGYTLSEEQKKT